MGLDEKIKGITVGRNGLGDTETRLVSGRYVRPERKTDLGIVLVSGLTGHWEDYMANFALPIGKIWPLYITELRGLKIPAIRELSGIATGKAMTSDLNQIVEQAKELMGIDRVVYIGHSMGNNAIASVPKKPFAYCLMSPYPSAGYFLNRNPNSIFSNAVEDGVDFVGEKLDFSFAANPLKKKTLDSQSNWIVPTDDFFGITQIRAALERIERLAQSAQGIFSVIPGNHCFNYQGLAPFNKDHPDDLIRNVTGYLETIGG